MSLGYVDSSCIVSVILGEPDHEAVTNALRPFEVLFSSGLLEAEVRAALAREGFPTVDPEGFPTEIEWVLPRRPLSQEIGTALEAGHLKGGDLWHVACALFARGSAGAGLAFLTLDETQREVAARLGFETPLAPGSPR